MACRFQVIAKGAATKEHKTVSITLGIQTVAAVSLLNSFTHFTAVLCSYYTSGAIIRNIIEGITEMHFFLNKSGLKYHNNLVNLKFDNPNLKNKGISSSSKDKGKTRRKNARGKHKCSIFFFYSYIFLRGTF